MNLVKQDNVPPNVRLELEKEVNSHKEVIQELLLEEKKLQFEETVLEYTNVSEMIDLEKASYLSEDEYVRRTRPMILRKLFVSCIGYAFYAPLTIVAMGYTNVDPTVMAATISLIEWIGSCLFGTFATSYLGYAAGRSVDKWNPNFKYGDGVLNKAVKGILKLDK